ncbi:MAG: UDP-glucose/GDP-mannose dehydrogenase family protein [Deltaproteobacteria bacterium]|nr:UDP-glucose/GDP-mannose dehydrogenase family protein [Deltaproteobacteria bacterium]
MKVSIIGTGYVGLVTGVCLAEKGHDVVCVDVDAEKVDKINRGIPPFFERGLEELLKKNLGPGIRATADLKAAVMGTDLTMIAVGTPFDGKEIDLSFVRKAARDIGTALGDKPGYHLVIVKSTVVPGTTEDVVLPLLESASRKKAGRDFGVGMNPEFLTEGEAIGDFMSPDRIVLGGIDSRSLDLLAELYRPFPGIPQLRTNPRTAEMIKYASNSLLAAMISFSNEIGNLCAGIGGIDVVDVMKGVHLSKYISVILPGGERHAPGIEGFLAAGCGFGGSCLPKDVNALIAHGEKSGTPMPLLSAVIEINRRQHMKVIGLLKKHFPSLSGVRVAVLGLAFRPDTDDMRESPAIPIVRELVSLGASVQAYDPVARDEAMKVLGNRNIRYAASAREAVEAAQAVVLVTRWDEFRSLPELFSSMERQPVFVDGRRLIDPDAVEKYEGIGF